MAISLDPSVNPILRMYELFEEPGVEPLDSAQHLGITNVPIRTLGSEPARELIRFLRRSARPGIQTCRLKMEGQPIINFAAASVADWFEWSVISHLAEQGSLSAECHAILSEWQEPLELYAQEGYWPDGGDIEADVLTVLGGLDHCTGKGKEFILEVSLNKAALIEQHLLPDFAHLSGQVSLLIWRNASSMSAAFDDFHSFLVHVAREAAHPILLLFHQPSPPYYGDYFKVLSLGGPRATLEQREQCLYRQLEAITPEVVAGYDDLRMCHQSERRPDVGDRFHLSSALLLRQAGHLPKYLEDPPFQEGPWRSLLIYILLAWLAERTTWKDDVAHFTLASGEEIALKFTLQDVRWKGASTFETGAEWQATVPLLALDLQRSAGREPLRARWAQAMSDQLAARYTASRFFEFLEAIRQAFIKQERRPLDMGDRHPDLELRVFFDKEATGGRLTFELHSPRLGWFHEPAGNTTTSAANEQRWLKDLDEMARSYLGRSLRPVKGSVEVALPAIYELKTLGGELWAELIPTELQRYYVKFRERPELNILIVSSDPSFPWELVKPYARKGELTTERLDDVWWAMKFGLARWLAGTRPPANEIGFTRVCCVAATTDLPAAARDVAFFQGLNAKVDLPKSRADLLKLLCEKPYDVLHFSCHGQFNAAEPDESRILLPDGELLSPRDFRTAELEDMVSENRPLVFLNACHSGQAGPTLTGLGGWAKRFIDMECGAFIGCGWEVSDKLAAEFATSFYQSFGNGATLGQAVREARETLRRENPDNSTWLAYYLYGNPYCLIKEES